MVQKCVGSFLPKDACVNLVDLVESFQTSIYLQNVPSTQPRTNPSISRFRALGNLNLNFERTNRLFATRPKCSADCKDPRTSKAGRWGRCRAQGRCPAKQGTCRMKMQPKYQMMINIYIKVRLLLNRSVRNI